MKVQIVFKQRLNNGIQIVSSNIIFNTNQLIYDDL